MRVRLCGRSIRRVHAAGDLAVVEAVADAGDQLAPVGVTWRSCGLRVNAFVARVRCLSSSRLAAPGSNQYRPCGAPLDGGEQLRRAALLSTTPSRPTPSRGRASPVALPEDDDARPRRDGSSSGSTSRPVAPRSRSSTTTSGARARPARRRPARLSASPTTSCRARLAMRVAQALADDRVIVHEQHADRLVLRVRHQSRLKKL